MSIFISILYVLGGLIVLLLIIGLFMKKGYRTHSKIIIEAPAHQVFDHLKHIRNQDNYNKWVMIDPNMQKTYTGADGTVGFIYGWNGNKEGGEGEQEITAIIEDKSVQMEIRFVRPFAGIAYAEMTSEALAADQTKVTWTTASTIKYPLNIMLPMLVKMLEKDMAISLATLKGILEDG